jgi:hypothetical protein
VGQSMVGQGFEFDVIVAIILGARARKAARGLSSR